MPNKLLSAAIIVGLLLTPIVHAGQITYSYIGPDFDRPDPLPAPYSAGDHVEGYITIDDSYLDSTGTSTGALQAIDYLSVPSWLVDLSFTDGVKTIDYADLTTLSGYSVAIYINAFDLVAWDIVLLESTVSPLSRILTQCGNVFGPFDPLYYCGGAAAFPLSDSAGHPSAGGTVHVWVDDEDPTPGNLWTSTLNTVPVPAPLALIGLGLAAIGITRHKPLS